MGGGPVTYSYLKKNIKYSDPNQWKPLLDHLVQDYVHLEIWSNSLLPNKVYWIPKSRHLWHAYLAFSEFTVTKTYTQHMCPHTSPAMCLSLYEPWPNYLCSAKFFTAHQMSCLIYQYKLFGFIHITSTLTVLLSFTFQHGLELLFTWRPCLLLIPWTSTTQTVLYKGVNGSGQTSFGELLYLNSKTSSGFLEG